MVFNIDICKVLHDGKNNNKSNYEMEGQILDSLKEKRDLGLIISSDLKVAEKQ